MPKPTQKQIEAEIKTLELCKSYVPRRTMFGDDNHRKLDLAAEYLRGDIDETADEFNSYSDDEQSAILEARDWMEGEIEESPSSGWDDRKPKPVKTKKKK